MVKDGCQEALDALPIVDTATATKLFTDDDRKWYTNQKDCFNNVKKSYINGNFYRSK